MSLSLSKYQSRVADKIADMIKDRLETEGCDGCGTLSFEDCDRLATEISARFVQLVDDPENEDDYDGQPDEAQEWADFDPDC